MGAQIPPNYGPPNGGQGSGGSVPPPSGGGQAGASGGGGGNGVDDQLVPGGYAQPYFDWQNLSSATAGYGAQALPDAAAYQQSLFQPGLNRNEEMFMESEMQRQQRALGPAMARMQAQFGSTPMHSGMMNSFREMGEGMAMNLGNQALQLSLNRQNQATGQLDRILGSPIAAASQGAQASSGLANLSQGLYNSLFSGPMSFLNQSPVVPPTIFMGGGGGGKFG